MAKYVNHGYQLVFEPPFIADDVGFFGFMIDADKEKLQAMIDKTLNEPLGRPGAFVPAGDFLMLAACKLPSLRSSAPGFDMMGTYAENEVAFWVPVIDTKRAKLFWAFPYIWVDNPFAFAMGRELYGFPKGIGTITLPDDPSNPDLFALETMGVKEFGPDAVGENMELMTIKRGEGERGDDTIFQDLEKMVEELVTVLKDGFNFLKHIRLAIHTIDDLLHLRMPMVFLKQFRDVTNYAEACYQAVIESEAGATKLHTGRLYSGEFQITINECASAPIVADLGLATGTPIESKLAFYMNFDFEIAQGTEVTD